MVVSLGGSGATSAGVSAGGGASSPASPSAGGLSSTLVSSTAGGGSPSTTKLVLFSFRDVVYVFNLRRLGLLPVLVLVALLKE